MDPILYRAVATGTNLHLLTQNKHKLLTQKTFNKNTVLHVASQYGQLEAVKLILSLTKDALLLKHNRVGEYPLHLAAKAGHTSIVRAIIDCAKDIPIPAQDIESHGADVEVQAVYKMLRNDCYRNTPLHEAVRYHRVDIVKMLIEEDPDHPYSNSIRFPLYGTPLYESPLYLAARRRFHECVKVIVDKCKQPDFEGPNGRTALHGAVISNSKECVGLLLKWKPTLTTQTDEYRQTPLHYVAHFGYADLVSHLLQNHMFVAYADDLYSNTALHIAAMRGHVSVMKEILLYNPDCWDMLGEDGRNILHMAVAHQQVNVVEYILQQEDCKIIDKIQLVNQMDRDSNTPLHLLSVSDCFAPQLISDPITDKGLPNHENMTPLDLVTYDDKSTLTKAKIAKELIHAGATSSLPYRISKNKKDDDKNEKKSYEKTVKEDYEDENSEHFDPLENLQKRAKTHIIVTTLVATITFAAGFTMPGGYIQSGSKHEGMTVLTKSAPFKAFIVSDTIALLLSTTAISMYFAASIHAIPKRIYRFLFSAVFLNMFALLATMVAFITTMVAFITGTYAVLRTSFGIALAVCLIGSSFFLVYVIVTVIFLYDIYTQKIYVPIV